jgi:hypothetical protein
MPAKTTQKGEIGEAMVIADLIRQGHDVAIPFGHNQPFDLIVIRKENRRLEKIQVKYTSSDGEVIRAVIRSSSAWVQHRYTREEVDWMAIYESQSQSCFYIPAFVWDGYHQLALRLKPTRNGQVRRVRWAADFVRLTGDPQDGSSHDAALPFDVSPE